MKLKKYLETKKLTQEKFIEELHQKTGHRLTQGGLSKYINFDENGKSLRYPRPAEIKVIYEFTEGAVTPNDFYL